MKPTIEQLADMAFIFGNSEQDYNDVLEYMKNHNMTKDEVLAAQIELDFSLPWPENV